MLRRLEFNFWYLLGRAPWDSGVSPPELLEFIRTHPPGRAIDLGCGTGTNVITLAKAGWQVTGMDFAVRAIQIARHKLSTAGIAASLVVGDVTRFEIDSQFDLALDLGCFHGVKNKPAYLDQLFGALRPGGHWLMYGFFKPDARLSGPGLLEADLDNISRRGLTQLSRQDGWDRRERPSVWFLYRKNES